MADQTKSASKREFALTEPLNIDNNNALVNDDLDEDELIHLRYIQSKTNRKKIELSTQALENRIALLENEDIKTKAKIDETRRKAYRIIEIKGRHKTDIELQNKRKSDQAQVVREKTAEVTNMKTEMVNAVEGNRAQHFEETVAAANDVKNKLAVCEFSL